LVSLQLIENLPIDNMNDAFIYEISVFLSIILINEKGALKPLTIKAKINPKKGVLVDDFNNDEFKNILIGGNH
jgi:hypothetical protein